MPGPKDEQVVEGNVTRVPLSGDGHFWVRVSINGVSRRFLVDTGATLTTISPDTARETDLTIPSDGRKSNCAPPMAIRQAGSSLSPN
jgi:aspartyl protease family protein